jgi:hypothetical protein
LVSLLILSGLSTNPDNRPTFDETIEELKKNLFRIAGEVDSEAVSTVASSVESSEPEKEKHFKQTLQFVNEIKRRDHWTEHRSNPERWRAQNENSKGAFRALNWNTVGRLPGHLTPIQRVRIDICLKDVSSKRVWFEILKGIESDETSNRFDPIVERHERDQYFNLSVVCQSSF